MPWWWWPLVQLVVWCCAAMVMVLCWLWATKLHVDAPGPPTIPILGNVLQFSELPVKIRKLRDIHRQYGDLTRIYLGPVLALLVAHPDDVQHILVTCKVLDRDPFTRQAMGVFSGDAILTLNGARWKEHRKLINRTFHSDLLEGFLVDFHEGGLLVSKHLASTQGRLTEIHPLVLVTALRCLCKTALGLDADLMIPDTLGEVAAATAMRSLMDMLMKMTLRPWLRCKFLLNLTSSGRSILKYTQELRDGAMRCIAMRSAATDEGAPKKRLCLLETLVKPGGETLIPVNEVQNEMVGLAAAGIETMGVTLSFVLALLSLHPTWQDAVHQELREVFGEGDDYLRAASLADLNSLRVLDSVIKETLRLYPSVPVIPRMASEDIRLAGGRVLVPKGTILVVSPFLTHRLPQFFPDPDSFDPSRFLDGCAGKDHPGSYLPFGLGARNCAGYQFARLEVKVFLSVILRRFRFLPHSSREDLEQNTFSASSYTIEPIRVSCTPLQVPCA